MLIPVISNVSYVPPGFLVYGQRETLLAQPFDAKKLRVTGQPFRVEDNVKRGYNNWFSLFSGANGVLFYRGAGSSKAQLGWYSRNGSRLGLIGGPEVYEGITMAPDEKRLAVQRPDPLSGTSDIWILELSSGIFSRVTLHTDRDSPAKNSTAVWSPNGRDLIFSSERNGEFDLYRKAVGGGNED